MTLKIKNPSGIAALALLCISLAPVFAQTKPPESMSKVKKVLLYNKIGGWVAVNSIAETKAVFTKLSASKGFELVQKEDDTDITLDFLKQFQAIVWNNNSNARASMSSATARQAVIDYLEQGGGWMLIGVAGDHYGSWPELTERMGTFFRGHGQIDSAEIVVDSAAKTHGELKWMVDGFPDVFVLKDLFPGFQNTVRPLPGVTVIATTRNIPGKKAVAIPPADGSGDNAYIWAREFERGRFLHNPIGYGQYSSPIMAQQDSIVPKLYWEHLRYVAGDYQNGCTTPTSQGFDPGARVHVESMCTPTGLKTAPTRPRLVVSKGNLRLRLAAPEGPLRVRLRNLQGKLLWEQVLPAGTREIALDGALEPGLHLIELQGKAGTIQSRLLLP